MIDPYLPIYSNVYTCNIDNKQILMIYIQSLLPLFKIPLIKIVQSRANKVKTYEYRNMNQKLVKICPKTSKGYIWPLNLT